MRLKHRARGEIKVRLEGSIFARKMILPLRDFISIRETEGWPLLIAAILALAWANSPWQEGYQTFWNREVLLEIGDHMFRETPRHLINDALLPIFFFILGLDLKHELVIGELSTWKRAAMPLFLGFGGMLVPVMIYLLLNPTGSATQGWGVPIATDVAFTLAILMLFGRRIPLKLKILTIAFAAVDDVGGVLAIALFYTDRLSLVYLAVTLGLFGFIYLLKSLRVTAVVPYTFAVLGFLFTMYHSGIHTTIAGVVLGLTVPARPFFPRKKFVPRIDELNSQVQKFREQIHRLERKEKNEEELTELEELRDEEEAVLGQMETLVNGTESGVERLLRTFNPWVTYVVLPLFALSNAGLRFDVSLWQATLNSPVAWGVFLGLLIGKPLGITMAAVLAEKSGFASLPTGIGWHHVAGMGLLAGMGFTVSLFIANLAFSQSAVLLPAKTAVLAASVGAGLLGYLFLRTTCRV